MPVEENREGGKARSGLNLQPRRDLRGFSGAMRSAALQEILDSRIMEATDLTTFHRWLLNGSPARTPSIVVHGQKEIPAGFAAAVARHLNEFDEDAGGNWLAFSPGLVERIAESFTQRSLLNIGASCQCTDPARNCSHLRETLASLARHGRAVLRGAGPMDASANVENVFRVWLGYPPETAGTVHLILHPDHFRDHSLPAIIADTFLEWADERLIHAGEREGA